MKDSLSHVTNLEFNRLRRCNPGISGLVFLQYVFTRWATSKKLGIHDRFCHASLLSLWVSLLICLLLCKSDFSFPINDEWFGAMQFILLVSDLVVFWWLMMNFEQKDQTVLHSFAVQDNRDLHRFLSQTVAKLHVRSLDMFCACSMIFTWRCMHNNILSSLLVSFNDPKIQMSIPMCKHCQQTVGFMAHQITFNCVS